MEIQNARIFQVLQIEMGTTKAGKEWKKRSFVIETDNAEYPKKIYVSVWGELTSLPLNIGDMIDVQFDIESREYNGRWYTDVKVYRLNINGAINNIPKKENETVNKNFPFSPIENSTSSNIPIEDVPSDLPF